MDIKNTIKTLLTHLDNEPERDGLAQTPQRVAKSWLEHTVGKDQDAAAILNKTFENTANYDSFVLLKDIEFYSHCEHHLAPITGNVSIAYIPNQRVVGISKLARLVDVFAKRLQIQEKMTMQIAQEIETTLGAKGVAVVISAKHHCLNHRGVNKKNTTMLTMAMLGEFKKDFQLRQEFWWALKESNLRHPD